MAITRRRSPSSFKSIEAFTSANAIHPLSSLPALRCRLSPRRVVSRISSPSPRWIHVDGPVDVCRRRNLHIYIAQYTIFRRIYNGQNKRGCLYMYIYVHAINRNSGGWVVDEEIIVRVMRLWRWMSNLFWKLNRVGVVLLKCLLFCSFVFFSFCSGELSSS